MSVYPDLVGVRLDQVFTYGNQLSFLIPQDWKEIDEGDCYCYEQPDQQGWLRVSLFTARGQGKGSKANASESLKNEAKQLGRDYFELGDNLVQRWKEFSEREGISACNCHWTVSRCFPADVNKKALFTFTLPSARLHAPKTKQLIELLSELFSKAEFSEQKG